MLDISSLSASSNSEVHDISRHQEGRVRRKRSQHRLLVIWCLQARGERKRNRGTERERKESNERKEKITVHLSSPCSESYVHNTAPVYFSSNSKEISPWPPYVKTDLLPRDCSLFCLPNCTTNTGPNPSSKFLLEEGCRHRVTASN